MTITPGTYQHWKGPQYLVLGLGHDANDPERTAVVYLPLYPVEGPPFAVRTLEDFTSWVDPTTGATVPEGQGIPRFALLTSSPTTAAVPPVSASSSSKVVGNTA